MQANTGSKLVPTVLQFPPPLPPTSPTLSEFSCRGTRARVKPPSRQVHSTHNYRTLCSYFQHIFQIVRPNVRSLYSLRSAGINEFDMSGVRHIRTGTLQIRMSVHKKLRRTFFINHSVHCNLSEDIQQPCLTITNVGMKGIYPVIYLLFRRNHS
jgi:hypothetical protein